MTKHKWIKYKSGQNVIPPDEGEWWYDPRYPDGDWFKSKAKAIALGERDMGKIYRLEGNVYFRDGTSDEILHVEGKYRWLRKVMKAYLHDKRVTTCALTIVKPDQHHHKIEED